MSDILISWRRQGIVEIIKGVEVMNDENFSNHQIKPVLEHPEVLKTAELHNVFLKICSWMNFPSSEQGTERETTEEILNTKSLNRIKEALKKELADDFSLECFAKDFSALLHLLPDPETWINRPFTLNGLRENQKTCFSGHQRVFVLLMECLEQGDGNFTRAFTTLKIDYKLPKKNKRKKLIQKLGCQDFFRTSYLEFKSVTLFILALYTLLFLARLFPVGEKSEDDIAVFLQWCLFYKEKLLALKIPHVPESRSYILRSEWIPPIDLEKHIALSGEEKAAFDQNRSDLWKKMKTVFMTENSKS